MSNLVSPSKPRFLRDENVKKRVEIFLKQKGFDVITAPKGISNGKLAPISKSEERILLTNDSDFADSVLFPKEKIFSIVLLRIPQDEPEALLKAFSMLLKEKTKQEDFEGKLIVLEKGKFEIFPILSVSALP